MRNIGSYDINDNWIEPPTEEEIADLQGRSRTLLFRHLFPIPDENFYPIPAGATSYAYRRLVDGPAIDFWREEPEAPAQGEAVVAALVDAVELLLTEETDSYCEHCRRHAPKDDEGCLTGPIAHKPDCVRSFAETALKAARSLG